LLQKPSVVVADVVGGLDLADAQERMAVADKDDKIKHRQQLRQIRLERKRKLREVRDKQRAHKRAKVCLHFIIKCIRLLICLARR
jgi:hypothetical protein